MQISTGNLSEAKSSLSEMQNSDQNTFKKLIDIYPEVLQVEEMNQFFQPYKDNPNKWPYLTSQKELLFLEILA